MNRRRLGKDPKDKQILSRRLDAAVISFLTRRETVQVEIDHSKP